MSENALDRCGNTSIDVLLRRITEICKDRILKSNKKIEIGERLAAVRAAHRLSQKAIGERLEISWRTYQNYEVGTREIPVDFVMKFCGEFGVRPEWLVNGQGGKRAIQDFGEFKTILLAVSAATKVQNKNLKLEDLADISVMLFRKANSGVEITKQDIEDYVALKVEG